MRPIWKGHISFGLVMIPVVLYSAVKSESRLDLDMLDERDQARIRYKKVNERTGKEVPLTSIVKGYEYQDGKYVILSPADFKAAGEGAVKGVELTEFVEAASIDPVSFDTPYYLEPAKDGQKGYILLRETLKRSGRVGIAKVVIQMRQHLACLMPKGDMLMLITMRYADELRSPDEFEIPRGEGGTARAAPAELKMAEMLVQTMTAKWDPLKHKDNYRAVLNKFIKQRIGTKGPRAPALTDDEEELPQTYNLMDMLRKSVEGSGESGAKRRSSVARRGTVKRPARQRAS